MNNNPGQNTAKRQSNAGPMIVIGALFFIFGFVTWVNSLLIPYFKLICSLTVKEAMLVTFAFYISYFVMALPASVLLHRVGYKKGMMIGLFVMALGTLIFIPAAGSRTYWLFLTGLFVEATGLTLLQTASNPYVTVLGPIERAAQRISIMGVCNKGAGALAPLLLASVLVRSPNEIDDVTHRIAQVSPAEKSAILDALSHRLIAPYLAISAVLVVLGLLIRWTHLPDIGDDKEDAAKEDAGPGLLRHKHLILGVVAIFAAVGVEVIAVDTVINYAQYTGASFREAKYFASLTLVAMIVSYVTGIFAIPKFITQRKALLLSASLGLLCVLLALATRGIPSVLFISLAGFGNAMLWPSIWPLSLDGLGKWTSRGSALLIMGIVGGAIVPPLYGVLSDAINPHGGYWVMVPLYLFLIYFAAAGYRAGRRLA